MSYLDRLSTDPVQTQKFDRFMLALYAALLIALLLSGLFWLVAQTTGIFALAAS